MGWFTGGWFVEGWFKELATTSTIVNPAMISTVSSVTKPGLKLGLNKTASLQRMAISSPGAKSSINANPTPGISSLRCVIGYEPNVKTGVKIQAQSLNDKLGININGVYTGINLPVACFSLSYGLVGSPLLRTGITHNITSFDLVTSLGKLKISETISSVVLKLVTDQLPPMTECGFERRELPYVTTSALRNVRIKIRRK